MNIANRQPNWVKTKLATAILPLSLLLGGCGDDNLDPNAINAPDVYEFASITDPSAASSVDYREATTRLILIKELEYLIGSEYFRDYGKTHTRQETVDLLNRIYMGGTKLDYTNNLVNVNLYSNATEATPISGINLTSGLALLQTSFYDLHENINLKDVMPGETQDLIYRNDDYPTQGDLIGWKVLDIVDEDHLPHLMVQSWFDSIAKIANERAEDDNSTRYIVKNIDYQALLISFLINTVSYSQATQFYLNTSNGLNSVNTDSNLPFTDLMHQWDLAFGSLGASRDIQSREPQDVINNPDHDSNGDNQIDIYTEYNFDLIKTMIQRDIDSYLSISQFSHTKLTSFLTGRRLIDLNYQQDPRVSLANIQTQATKIINSWERVNAANAIHLINKNASLIQFVESSVLSSSYAESWSNLKGLSLALQFNPYNTLTKEQLTDLHGYIGQYPVTSITAINTSSKQFYSAVQIFQNHYGFSQAERENW